VDSNILINSNRNYRQKYFPVVWDFFLNTPDLYMLDRVYRELVSKDDELRAWIKRYYSEKILTADESIAEYQKVNQYLQMSGLENTV
jgi:hypothetical protein